MSSDPIQLDQEMVYARVSADSYFPDIKVLLELKGVVDADVAQALATLNAGGTGKIGAVVIVLQPKLIAANEPDAPGPSYRIQVSVQVIVNRLLNDDVTNGTGKMIASICTRLRQILHQFGVGRGGLFVFESMEPDAVAPGLLGYTVVISRKAGDVVVPKVAFPTITPAALIVTLATTTPGASLLYSLDQSYPTLPYSVPVNIGVAGYVCVIGRATGYQDSDIRMLYVS